MLLGILPSEQLLSQYRLTEYTDVAAAMRTGDVGLLMRCMDANQLAFVQVFRMRFAKFLVVNYCPASTHGAYIPQPALASAPVKYLVVWELCPHAHDKVLCEQYKGCSMLSPNIKNIKALCGVLLSAEWHVSALGEAAIGNLPPTVQEVSRCHSVRLP